MRVERIDKDIQSPAQSAFLKANTRDKLLVIETGGEILQAIPKGQVLKIKLEVDTDPPPDFATQTRYLLQPIPFSVRFCTSGSTRRQNARRSLPKMEKSG